jgi:hypothetical protein
MVDYYRSVIGTPHADLIDDPSGSGATLRIVRVEGLREVLTCRDCWGTPSARAELASAWRTGLLRGEG